MNLKSIQQHKTAQIKHEWYHNVLYQSAIARILCSPFRNKNINEHMCTEKALMMYHDVKNQIIEKYR